MNLLESMRKRHSVRRFISKEVRTDDLREMVRRALLAPSIDIIREHRFVAITNGDLLERMAKEVSAALDAIAESHGLHVESWLDNDNWYATFFRDAPAVIAVAFKPVPDSDTEKEYERESYSRGHPEYQSVGACIQNMLLTAVDLGLTACWLTAPLVARDRIESLLDLRSPWKLAALVAVGHAEEAFEPSEMPDPGDSWRLIT